jgi:hypothetical protein
MSQKIQFRRGTDAARQTVVFDLGEPVYTTDTNKYYIGDGSTAGGVLVGGNFSNSESYVIVETTNSEILNGLNLLSASNAASSKTPYGKRLDSGNQYSILLPPAVYDLQHSGVVIESPFINLAGISNSPRDTLLISDGIDLGVKGVIVIRTGNINISNLSTLAVTTGTNGCAGLQLVSNPPPGGSSIIENVNVNNMIMNISGNNRISNSEQPSNCFVGGLVTGIFNRINFNNIVSYGPFMNNNTVSHNKLDITIKNSIFYGDKNFYKLGSFIYPTKIILDNCQIYGNSGFLSAKTSSTAASLYDRESLIDDCYISGNDTFRSIVTPSFGNLLDNGFIGTIKNTVIYGNIFAHVGKFEGCYINGASYTGTAVTFLSGNTLPSRYPIFSNCTIVKSNSSASVTGYFMESSGIFMNCKFDKSISTGITGLLGSESIGNILLSSKFDLY